MNAEEALAALVGLYNDLEDPEWKAATEYAACAIVDADMWHTVAVALAAALNASASNANPAHVARLDQQVARALHAFAVAERDPRNDRDMGRD